MFKLPYMTDPRGRHWGQPGGLRDRVTIYATGHATISEADWLDLSDYRNTLPSSVYPGKVWRSGPWLCWYGPEIKKLGTCRVVSVRALIQ